MANLYDTSALKALNEKDYINELYGNNSESEKKLIQDNYTDNVGILDKEQTRVEQQTQENVNRTQVEAQTAQDQYTGPRLTAGANQQEDLARENALQGNTGSLQQKQSELDMEIERQRKLLASQYETAIKQAQAENDMQKAQALYNAAKAEEAKLLSLRQQAASMMAGKGDMSILTELMSGKAPEADFTGKTWEQVLKNEDELNAIYDKQLEAQLLGIQSQREEAMSDLDAKQQEQQAQTDEDLTQAYVDALQKMKNYAEVQTAYGQGSGTAGAARIAQDVELQKMLTDIRLGQMDADAGFGADRLDAGRDFAQQLEKALKESNQKRSEELIKAAEQEEENLYNTQLAMGQILAKNGDYSVLAKLYGLTPDQLALLQGNVGGGGGYGGYSRGGGGSSDIVMEAAQVAKKYGSGAAIDAVNKTSASQAVKNAAIQNAQGVAMTEYYKNRVVK